jgi:predicted GNAT family acetyltransferase
MNLPIKRIHEATPSEDGDRSLADRLRSRGTKKQALTLPVTHNVKLQRFESQAGNASLAFLSYTHEGDHVILDHTFVPDALRGAGMAASLVLAALNEARQRRWRIVPRCSYVAAFIKRNPEFADLVDRQDQKLT